MSTALYWRPDHKEKTELGEDLKHILARYFWGQDGSLTTHFHKLDEQDRHYHRGLADAGVKDAGKLLKATEEHGDILVWIGD